MLTIRILLYRLWTEKFAKGCWYSYLFQLFQFFQSRGVEVEGEPYHLRKTEIGIFPFLFSVKVFFVPLFTGFYDVCKLAVTDDVFISKFTSHQNSIWCAWQMQLNLTLQLPRLLYQIIYRFLIILLFLYKHFVFRSFCQHRPVVLCTCTKVRLIYYQQVYLLFKKLFMTFLNLCAT